MREPEHYVLLRHVWERYGEASRDYARLCVRYGRDYARHVDCDLAAGRCQALFLLLDDLMLLCLDHDWPIPVEIDIFSFPAGDSAALKREEGQ